ncbi:MAG TPA: helix-turn-helix transcriptional regulator [Acetobacteraceae bacterium]|nr:helix-turn-helix transcriptional regulator [Acetobacteraceae bacterium]
MVAVPSSRRELGDFIRAHRERLSPQVLGLPHAGRRRTPGLRREEAAALCGLSVTWYTWIEQGRELSVSPTALSRLAATLRLTRPERAYLFELAGRRDPEPAHGAETEMPAALRRCVQAIGAPAYVLDRGWNALVWNQPAERLFVGWLDRREAGNDERNLLRYIFLSPMARRLICGFETRARRVVAEFRADCGAHLNDPPLRALVADLRERSPLFASLWTEHAVLAREGGERMFDHPQLGFLRCDQISFILAAEGSFKLVMLTPAGETAAG